MKYLFINGSPHKGNTWKLVETVQGILKTIEPGSIIEEIHLVNLKLPFCTGCSLCFRTGGTKCPHNEAIQRVLEAIEEADGIIVASTTYNRTETTLLKNFFDHLCYLLHRPQFFTKKALVITTTGGVGAKSAAKSIASFLKGIGFNRCYLLSVAAYSWNDYKVDDKTRRKCEQVTKKFYQDISSEKLHSPSVEVMIPYNLFRGMSLHYVKGTPYETEDGNYWTDPIRKDTVYNRIVPVPFYKKPVGYLFYFLGKILGKRVMVTYKK